MTHPAPGPDPGNPPPGPSRYRNNPGPPLPPGSPHPDAPPLPGPSKAGWLVLRATGLTLMVLAFAAGWALVAMRTVIGP